MVGILSVQDIKSVNFQGKFFSEKFKLHVWAYLCVKEHVQAQEFNHVFRLDLYPRKLAHLYLSNGSCTFWLLVRFGCWVTPVENPVIHSPWYLLDRLHRVALLTEAVKAPIPSMLAAGCQSGKVKRVTSLLDAVRLLVRCPTATCAHHERSVTQPFKVDLSVWLFPSGSNDCSFLLVLTDLGVC